MESKPVSKSDLAKAKDLKVLWPFYMPLGGSCPSDYMLLASSTWMRIDVKIRSKEVSAKANKINAKSDSKLPHQQFDPIQVRPSSLANGDTAHDLYEVNHTPGGSGLKWMFFPGCTSSVGYFVSRFGVKGRGPQAKAVRTSALATTHTSTQASGLAATRT